MIRPNEDNNKLVRGYVIYTQWRGGCNSMDLAKDPNELTCDVAYTFWHRHDEDPDIVVHELELLLKCYGQFKGYEGCQIGYEYRDYRKS